MIITRGLIILVLLTACLGQLNRIPIGDLSGVVLYANDLLIGLAAVWYTVYVLAVRKSWVLPWQFIVFACFIALAPIGLLLSSHLTSLNIIVSLSYLVRYACYAIVAMAVFDDLAHATSAAQQKERLKKWLLVLISAGLLMSLSGFIQLFVLPDFADLAQYGWDPHIGRLATAMLDPNYAGAYLSIVAIVVCSLLLYVQSPRTRLRLVLIALILVAAVLLTYSRSAYLLLAIGLFVVAAYRARWLLLVAAIVSVVAFSAIPRVQERVLGAITVDVTASIRVISWQNSWTIARDNQPFGVGFNSYRYAQDRYGIVSQEDSGNAGAGADSSWLFILATTGIIGFVTYVLFYFSILLSSANQLLRSKLPPMHRATHLAVIAVWLAMIPASMINNSLFYTWILQLWMLMVGLSLGLAYMQARPSVVEEAGNEV